LVTPFDNNEDLDLVALEKQVIRVANGGMGICLLGTNGEASHLSDDERIAVIKTGRKALDKAGFSHLPILAGTGTGSAKQTVKLCQDAKVAGADYAIVIAPGYFVFAIGANKPTIRDFFIEVLDKSPIPVMIYNFPGAASGIDLDSDFINDLADHQNCFGVKLTCAQIGKGIRIISHTSSKEYKNRHPLPYVVLPGYGDYLLPHMLMGGAGCITGTGNVVPKVVAKLFNLCEEAAQTSSPEKLKEAIEFQKFVADVDFDISKTGITGTKYLITEHAGIGSYGFARLPLPKSTPAMEKTLSSAPALAKALALEKTL